MMCVYFSNILSNLLEHKGRELLEKMLNDPKCLDNLMLKMGDYTMSQLAIKLLTYKCKEEECLVEEKAVLLQRVVSLFLQAPGDTDPDYQQQLMCNLA